MALSACQLSFEQLKLIELSAVVLVQFVFSWISKTISTLRGLCFVSLDSLACVDEVCVSKLCPAGTFGANKYVLTILEYGPCEICAHWWFCGHCDSGPPQPMVKPELRFPGGALAGKTYFCLLFGSKSSWWKHGCTSRFWFILEISKTCRQIISTPRRNIFHAAKSWRMSYTPRINKVWEFVIIKSKNPWSSA